MPWDRDYFERDNAFWPQKTFTQYTLNDPVGEIVDQKRPWYRGDDTLGVDGIPSGTDEDWRGQGHFDPDAEPTCDELAAREAGEQRLRGALDGHGDFEWSAVGNLRWRMRLHSAVNAKGHFAHARVYTGRVRAAVKVSGLTVRVWHFHGPFSAALKVVGSPTNVQNLVGSTAAAVQASGDPAHVRTFTAAADVAVSIVTEVEHVHAITGTIRTSVDASGFIPVPVEFTGTIRAAVDASGHMTAIEGQAGTTAAAVDATGRLTRVYGFVGTIHAAAALTRPSSPTGNCCDPIPPSNLCLHLVTGEELCGCLFGAIACSSGGECVWHVPVRWDEAYDGWIGICNGVAGCFPTAKYIMRCVPSPVEPGIENCTYYQLFQEIGGTVTQIAHAGIGGDTCEAHCGPPFILGFTEAFGMGGDCDGSFFAVVDEGECSTNNRCGCEEGTQAAVLYFTVAGVEVIEEEICSECAVLNGDWAAIFDGCTEAGETGWYTDTFELCPIDGFNTWRWAIYKGAVPHTGDDDVRVWLELLDDDGEVYAQAARYQTFDFDDPLWDCGSTKEVPGGDTLGDFCANYPLTITIHP